MSTADKINIAFATDNNYVMPTIVAMTSLFENNPYHIEIYLLSIEGHLSDESKAALQECVERYGAQIHFADVPLDRFEGLPIFRHGLSTYLRIFAPELFPTIDKMLYLDSDIIIERSILELYNTNMEEYTCAGVADQRHLDTKYLNDIGYNHFHRFYINAGVLLMNLEKLRTLDLKSRAKEYIERYKDVIRLGDQDMINCIFPDILMLHPKYNAIASLIWNLFNCKRAVLWSPEWIKEAANAPTIIHFITIKKPWLATSKHLYKYRWQHYLAMTRYRDYRGALSIKERLQDARCAVNIYLKTLIKQIVLLKYRCGNFR